MVGYCPFVNCLGCSTWIFLHYVLPFLSTKPVFSCRVQITYLKSQMCGVLFNVLFNFIDHRIV